MSRFDGKLALVTGAGSGIGAAITRRLIRDGAKVIAADVTGKQDELERELGEAVIPRSMDVSKPEEVLALEKWIIQEYGGLDILANNAGIGGRIGPLHEYALEDFDQVMNINVRGAYLVLQAGIRLMLANGGGAVVNTASLGGFRATPSASAYIISKGAMVMMTRVAALEYATHNIRVNAVGPGTVKTSILDSAPESMVEMLEKQVPQERLGTPEEVANVVAFLADGAETSHVTGQTWLIDGGRSAG